MIFVRGDHPALVHTPLTMRGLFHLSSLGPNLSLHGTNGRQIPALDQAEPEAHICCFSETVLPSSMF